MQKTTVNRRLEQIKTSDHGSSFLEIRWKSMQTQQPAQPVSEHETPEIIINIRELSLEVVDDFHYFDGTLSQSETCEREIDHRMKSTDWAFGKFSKRVFNNHEHFHDVPRRCHLHLACEIYGP